MAFLTDRTLATGVTAQDLIHIVKPYDTTQNPAGSSYKATIQQTLEAITGATQVMILSSGIGSVERCGNGNDAKGNCSAVSGGQCNTATGTYSNVNGGCKNTSIGMISSIGGGCCNTTTNNCNTIGGGCNNTTSNCYSSIFAGANNTASGYGSSILGGGSNKALSTWNTLVAGIGNTSSGSYSFLGGGIANTTNGLGTTLSGGRCNTLSGIYNVITGGRNNKINTCYSSILGGCGNIITHQYSSAIGFNITSVSACTFHVNYLALNNTPINDQTQTQYLVRDSSTGVVKYKTTQPSYISTTDVSVSAYTANTSFGYYGVTFSGNTNIEIPSPTGIDGFSFKIKDERGTASSYPITVTTPVGLIDGNGSVVMSINYMSLLFVARNNNWWIV